MSVTKNYHLIYKLLSKVDSILFLVIKIKRIANNSNKFIKSIYNKTEYGYETIHPITDVQ